MISRVVAIDADPQYDYPFRLQPVLHSDERRGFLNARRAKTSPEIQHHYLSAILAQRDFAVGILHGKVRGVRANAGGTSTAVASDGNEQSKVEQRRKERSSHPAIIAKS